MGKKRPFFSHSSVLSVHCSSTKLLLLLIRVGIVYEAIRLVLNVKWMEP